MYKFGPDQVIKVGPVGNSYAYEIAGVRSAGVYHNASSARQDARRPQVLTRRGLVPEPLTSHVSGAYRDAPWIFDFGSKVRGRG